MCDNFCNGISCHDYDRCDQSSWHPVKIGLPLQDYHGQSLVAEIMVTVKYLVNDEREVMVAFFSCANKKFKDADGIYFDDNTEEVIAWRYMPNAYIENIDEEL